MRAVRSSVRICGTKTPSADDTVVVVRWLSVLSNNRQQLGYYQKLCHSKLAKQTLAWNATRTHMKPRNDPEICRWCVVNNFVTLRPSPYRPSYYVHNTAQLSMCVCVCLPACVIVFCRCFVCAHRTNYRLCVYTLRASYICLSTA